MAAVPDPVDRQKRSAASRRPAISVLIVAYQSAPTLPRCLAALAAQTFRDFEIIVVDNASSDGAPQRAREQAALANLTLALIEAGDNLGFAAGNNLAAQRARGQWLALLNPDAFPQGDWLENLMQAAKAMPQFASFASVQLSDDHRDVLDGAGDVLTLAGVPYRGGYGRKPQALFTGQVFSACGAAHLILRDLFVDMGGFDERFFCYCEDVDLGYRLRLKGHATVLVPGAVVQHVGSAVLGARSDFALYHGARNRLWLLVKNTPAPLVPVVVVLHLAALCALLLMHVRRGEARPVWRGLMAGLAGLGPALRARRQIQSQRTASSAAILAALAVNPLALFRRAVVIKPISRPDSNA